MQVGSFFSRAFFAGGFFPWSPYDGTLVTTAGTYVNTARYWPGTKVAISAQGTFTSLTVSVERSFDGFVWEVVKTYTSPTPTASAAPDHYEVSAFGEWLRIGLSAYSSGTAKLGLFGRKVE